MATDSTIPNKSVQILVAVEQAAQTLVNEFCHPLGVHHVRIEVRSVRPCTSYSELHGIFYPRGSGRRVAVTVSHHRRAIISGCPIDRAVDALGIDTGLVYGGKLSCVEFNEGVLYQIARGSHQVKSQPLDLD